MWATSSLPCRLWPHGRATRNQGLLTVSARYSRPRKNIHYDFDEEEEEEENEKESWKRQEMGDSDDASVEERGKISGSVVLLALEKARAQKTSNKAKKKKKQREVEDKRLSQGDSSKDYSAVKPLCIKSDWKDRLDELEMQLHHLLQKALKQHNGELKGGAKASQAGRPWICACIIQGFESKSEACKFEFRWKNISRKMGRKRNSNDEGGLHLLQHRNAALEKVKGSTVCSHLEFDWKQPI